MRYSDWTKANIQKLCVSSVQLQPGCVADVRSLGDSGASCSNARMRVYV